METSPKREGAGPVGARKGRSGIVSSAGAVDDDDEADALARTLGVFIVATGQGGGCAEGKMDRGRARRWAGTSGTAPRRLIERVGRD